MNSLRYWLRSNRGILVAVLVFCGAYAGILWFKYTYPPEVPGTVAHGVPVDTVPVSPETSIDATRPEVPQESAPRLVDTGSTSQATEPGAPDAPPWQDADTTGDVPQQDGDSDLVSEETAAPQPAGPEGDLAISGRVLDRAGSSVGGIKLVAKAAYLFDRDKGKLTPVYGYRRVATSGYDGAYAFERLADGEYHISTEATEQYSRAQISVRAGVDFADLVLTGQRELRVYGMVTTADGEPLAGVVVTPVTQVSPKVTSNKEGRYSFEVKLLDNAQSLAVRASKQDYENKEVRLDTTQPDAGNDLEMNIVMEPDADSALAEVSGRVTGPANEPVAGQRIQLSSAKARQNFRATTDADGRFVIRSVEPGDDYMLSINAVAAYKDYFQRNIKVTKNGLTLNVELEAGETGALSGQMVNLFGNPVPDFSLVLQTKETSYYNQRVLGDGAGNFEVENAPAGELRLRTKSTPYYIIEGIRLPAGGALNIPVVLDWGYDEMQGKVVDDNGYPVAVTNISLTWSHQANGMRSTSRRTTAADEQGNFRFTQLGPGSHRLSVNATGYKPVSVNHDVALQGSEVVVKLEEK